MLKQKLICLSLILICLGFCVSSGAAEHAAKAQAEAILQGMTLSQKLSQMIITTPESWSDLIPVTRAEQLDREKMSAYPYGGILIFGKNIVDADQLLLLNETISQSSVCPFILAQEEGGEVSRLQQKLAVGPFSSAEEIGQTGNVSLAYENGRQIGQTMKQLGFSMNLAPMADLAISTTSNELAGRCYARESSITAMMSLQFMSGQEEAGILSVIKHFPGIGRADTDTEESLVHINKDKTALYHEDLMPFRAAVAAGIRCVLMSSVVYDQLDPAAPAVFSKTIIRSILREEMGFQGIVISAPLNSEVFLQNYSVKQIGIMAVLAGCDMLLLPSNAEKMITYLQEAVLNGEITEERINESVLRILALKIETGIIPVE